MNKIIIILSIFLLSILPVGATRMAYDPSRSKVGNIVLGVAVETQDGKFMEGDQLSAVGGRIADYFASELRAHGIDKTVTLIFHFPWDCHFYGAKLARYRPSSVGIPKWEARDILQSERDLYVFIRAAMAESQEGRYSFRVCKYGATGLGFYWPDELPRPVTDLNRCLLRSADDLSEYALCLAKREIDATIFGMGKLESEEASKDGN